LGQAGQQAKVTEAKYTTLNQENQKNIKLLNDAQTQSRTKDEQIKNLQA
jgi:hypothetical protein